MGRAIKHPVPDRVKPSLQFLTSGHSDADAQPWVSERPGVENYKRRLNPFWHRMLYSSTHMATVGVKELTRIHDVQATLTYLITLAYVMVRYDTIRYDRTHSTCATKADIVWTETTGPAIAGSARSVRTSIARFLCKKCSFCLYCVVNAGHTEMCHYPPRNSIWAPEFTAVSRDVNDP